MANSQDNSQLNSRYYSLLAATPAHPDMEEDSEIDDLDNLPDGCRFSGLSLIGDGLGDDPDLYDHEIPDTPDASTPFLEFGSADFDQGNFFNSFFGIFKLFF